MAQNQAAFDCLVQYLSTLVEEHEETSQEYHLEIRRLPSRPGMDTLRARTFTEILKEITEGEEQSIEPKVRSAAFATWMTFLLRWRDYKHFRNVFDTYHNIFREVSPSLVSLYQGMRDLSQVSSKGDRQRAVESAKVAMKAMPDMPGALNLYTEAIATSGERGDMVEDDLDRALEAIENAIKFDSKYAKYYANRARILALKKRYEESYRDIDNAIDLEPSDNDEYQLRISKYESYRTFIQLEERSSEIEDQANKMKQEQERAQNQLSAMRGETLTLLGLLAAVIAFVVPSVQLVSNLQSAEAGVLMTFMAGLILVVFGAFMELIHPDTKWRPKGLFVVGVGILLVTLAGLVLWSGRIPGV